MQTPRFQPVNNLNKLVNHKIQKLYEKKHKVQTKKHRLKNSNNNGSAQQVKELKIKINTLRKEIYEEFNKASNNNWNKLVSDIDYKDSASFFPSLNKMFRKREREEIDEIIIDESEANFLVKNKIDYSALNRNKNNKFIVNNPSAIPDLVGAYFEEIQTADEPNHSPFENIVKEKVKNLRENFDKAETLTKFSDFSRATDPKSLLADEIDQFTNISEVGKLIKQLKNKTSFGWDGIPNIILKNVTKKIVKIYTIIINNVLNHLYYPESWKIAKLIASQKKKIKN